MFTTFIIVTLSIIAASYASARHDLRNRESDARRQWEDAIAEQQREQARRERAKSPAGF